MHENNVIHMIENAPADKVLHELLPELIGRAKCPECGICLKRCPGRQCKYLQCEVHGCCQGIHILPQLPMRILNAFIDAFDKAKLIELLINAFPFKSKELKELLLEGKDDLKGS